MIGYWGYPNGAIPASAMVNVEGFYFEPDMAARIRWALTEVRRQGGAVAIDEGYRPLGVPADRYVLVASKTSTGGSNQWFQKGREDRHLTPSAAWPGLSNHGYGQAADINYSNRVLVLSVFKKVGLLFPIASEPWHTDASGPNYVPAATPTKSRKRNEDMPALIKRTEGGAEWSLIWPPLDGGDELQKGYLATTDPERAKWWARFYEDGSGSEDKFNRADYVAAQKFARLDHQAWVQGNSATQ